MGRYGYGERNERGERLLEFATKHQLFVGNTRFQQKNSRKWTWRAPGGKYFNMIDLVLIDKRWKTALRNCRTYQGADISSDHSLVMAKLQLRLKRNGKRQTKTKLDIDALEEVQTRHEFAHKLEIMLDQQGRLDNINERVGALTSCIQQAMQETLPSIKTARKPYITAKTLELADKKEC